MLNLFTRKLKILFEVPKLCFLVMKRKEYYKRVVYWYNLHYFFFPYSFFLFFTISIWPRLRLDITRWPICMFHICKVLKQSKLAKIYNFIFWQNFRRQSFSSNKNFITSEKFRLFCPTFCYLIWYICLGKSNWNPLELCCICHSIP